MRKIFKEAIDKDLFLKLRNDFFSIIADEMFELIINNDHTVFIPGKLTPHSG